MSGDGHNHSLVAFVITQSRLEAYHAQLIIYGNRSIRGCSLFLIVMRPDYQCRNIGFQ